MIVNEDPDGRDTTRADLLVSRIMDAVTTGRTAQARSDALRLQAAWPVVRAWCDWVVAACHAIDGDIREASTVLRGIVAVGDWLGEPLLQDPSLEAVWSMPGGQGLRRALQQGSTTVSRPESCAPVRVVQDPRAVVVTIHGNGPLPLAAQRALWGEVPGVSVYALRSQMVVAPEVPVWTDRAVARQRLGSVVDELRTREGGVPVTVVGLGSGGTIALEAAGYGVRGVDRFVAVAPGRPPAVHGLSGPGEVVVVVDPSEEEAVAGLRAWIGQAGVRLDLLAGLGHAYPASFADYFAARLLDDTSVASGQRRNASRSVLPSLPDGGA